MCSGVCVNVISKGAAFPLTEAIVRRRFSLPCGGARARVPCADTQNFLLSKSQENAARRRLFLGARGGVCESERLLHYGLMRNVHQSERAREGGWMRGKEMSTIIYSFAKVARPTTLDANCKLECSARKCEQRKVVALLLLCKSRLNLRRMSMSGISDFAEIEGCAVNRELRWLKVSRSW